MPTVQVKSNIELGIEDILAGIDQLDTPELENFLQQVSQLLARRKAKSLSKKETELLIKINEGLSRHEAERYKKLAAKLEDETMTPEENREFLELVEIVEANDAERLKYLIELARLREVSLEELMQQLGLTNPEDE